MKKILLMNNTLTTGGISSSMVNTANELSSQYDVYIFCYLPEGTMKSRLSPKVTILDSSWRMKAMCSTLANAKKLGLKYLLFKIFARVWSKIFNNRLPIFIALIHQKCLGTFDLACSYTHEGNKDIEYTGLIRVLLKKVVSPKKLSWVHCDYNNVPFTTFNNRYFNKCDAIVGASKSIAYAFAKCNPGVSTKITYCYNMLDYKTIYCLADETLDINIPKDGIICFSACRISKIKALDRFLYACKDVFKKNNVYWYIAGDGPEKEGIQNIIDKLELSSNVIMLGEQKNPFKFIKKSDLYLSVSYEEAAPLVYFEAKSLHIPVFSTETLSTRELLDENVDYICANNNKSIVDAFFKATSSKDDLIERKKRLLDYVGNNDYSINFFKYWVGDLSVDTEN